jgi:hypothetical protein
MIPKEREEEKERLSELGEEEQGRAESGRREQRSRRGNKGGE